MSDQSFSTARFLRPTVTIVASFVGKNTIASEDLSTLIGDVHGALIRASTGKPEEIPVEPAKPAVPIKRSIQPDYLVCLNDGRQFRSLKRHLRSKYGLTPQEYRAQWGLPADYPMVAPNYAQERSQLAKAMGLGRKSRRPSTT